MGYYIEVPENKGKAEQLVALHGATILKQRPATFEDIPEGQALICIMDNGPFEAAALCYSSEELDAFDAQDDIGPEVEQGVGPGGVATFHMRSEYQARGDQRPRTWVMMEKTLAHQLAGYTG